MKRLIATALNVRREELKSRWRESRDLTEQGRLIGRIGALVEEERAIRIEIATATDMRPLIHEVERLQKESDTQRPQFVRSFL